MAVPVDTKIFLTIFTTYLDETQWKIILRKKRKIVKKLLHNFIRTKYIENKYIWINLFTHVNSEEDLKLKMFTE